MIHMKHTFVSRLAAFALFNAAILTTQAAINISFVETDFDVVATLSGSLDNQPTAGWSVYGTGAVGNNAFVTAANAGFGIEASSSSMTQNQNTVTTDGVVVGLVPWSGSPFGTSAGVTNAGGFHLFPDGTMTYYNRGDAGFTPNPNFTGTMTFSGATLSSLGFDAGEILAGAGSFSVGDEFLPIVYETINWSVTPVPEPGEYAAIAAVAMLGFVAYRRRKAAKA